MAAHVFVWFVELDTARSTNGFGFNPISFTDIDAYSRINGVPMREWEVAAIRKMDLVRLKKLNGGKDEPVVASRPMTPALFNGLFAGG